MRILAATIVILAALLGRGAVAQDHAASTGTWVVKGKRLVPVEGAPIDRGAVRISGAKIDAISAAPDTTGVPEAHILDFPEGIIYPGLIDAGCYEGIRRERDDQTKPCQPNNRIVDAYDAAHPSFARNFAAGVTTVHLVPGNSGVVGGRTAVVKVGEGASTRVLSADAGLKVSLVEDAYPDGRPPTSVIGALALLRDPPDDLGKDLDPFKKGGTNVFVSAATNREILLAAGLRKELGFKTVLFGDQHCARFSQQLKDGVAAVVLDPLSLVRQPYEWRELSGLFATGIPIAFATWAPFKSSSAVRLSAIIAARQGIDADRALRAITLDAAKILGVDASVGSLKAGKDADLIVLSGELTDARSRLLLCVQDGKVVFRAPKETP